MKYPNFAQLVRDKSRKELLNPVINVDFPDINEEIGHTFCHYLYTGCYETLNANEVDNEESSRAELRSAFLVRDAARVYSLTELEVLSNLKISELDEKMQILSVLPLWQEIYPKISEDDQWFHQHLSAKLKYALDKDEKLFLQEQFLELVGVEPRFLKAVFAMTAEICAEKIKEAQSQSCKGVDYMEGGL